MPKSLQPPSHFNHSFVAEHFPMRKPSSGSISCCPFPFTRPDEYPSCWQKRFAPKLLSQKKWPQIGLHFPSQNTSGSLSFWSRASPFSSENYDFKLHDVNTKWISEGLLIIGSNCSAQYTRLRSIIYIVYMGRRLCGLFPMWT